MGFDDLAIFLLKACIPGLASVVFRAVAFGYSTKRRLALGLIFYTFYIFVLPGSLIFFWGYGEYTHVSGIVMGLGALVVLVFTTDTPGKTIFLQLSQTAMMTCVSVLLNITRTILHLPYASLLIMTVITTPLIFIIGLRLWARPMRFLVDNLYDSIVPLLVAPCIIFAIVTLIPVYPPQNFSNHPIFCTSIIILAETA